MKGTFHMCCIVHTLNNEYSICSEFILSVWPRTLCAPTKCLRSLEGTGSELGEINLNTPIHLTCSRRLEHVGPAANKQANDSLHILVRNSKIRLQLMRFMTALCEECVAPEVQEVACHGYLTSSTHWLHYLGVSFAAGRRYCSFVCHRLGDYLPGFDSFDSLLYSFWLARGENC